MIEYDYTYDLLNQPYLSEILDPSSGRVIQSFLIPPGVTQIRGARVKLSKFGSPGLVKLALGSTPGGDELGQGLIQPDQVLPVFELWVGVDFPPAAVQAGETCWLTLQVLEGQKPLDAYRIYGPNIYDHTGGPESAHLPWWWSDVKEFMESDDLDIPLPADYRGAAYPDYPGGNRCQEDGSSTWSISFQIITDHDDTSSGEDEQRFEFTRKLLAPPFSEWINLRDDQAVRRQGEVQIDESWNIAVVGVSSPIAQNAAQELKVFLERVMGILLGKSGFNRLVGLEIQPEANIPDGNESFLAEIEATGISIIARSDRGLLRAVHWLEDKMLLRRAPLLLAGSYHIKARFATRMVPAIYPAPAYYQLHDAEIWTPGYMWRLARAGYNAIYLPANMEEFVEGSEFFPEMNDPLAGAALERLRRITEIGAAYGVDVYLDLKTGYMRRFRPEIYERLPGIRAFQRFGNYPCSGQKVVLDFYQETLARVFLRAPKLKGVIVIYDTEGFFSCFLHNQQHRCEYCKDFPLVELSNRLFKALQDGIRRNKPDAELILWSYFCDQPWNYEVIRAMPEDVSLMACFSQFVELDRFGIRVRTDDYSICSEEPSANFLKIQSLAREKGMRFLCKTEDTFGQEFVSTPYTPCLEQHQRRWDRVIEQQVDGYLSQYVHLGFMPGPCADLARQNLYDIEKDGARLEPSAVEKLHNVAVIQFGEAAVGPIVQAWQAFSRAIHDYFPYTWGVCRYPGPLQSSPAQPFYLDPSRRVPRLRSRGFVKNLAWTGIDPRFLVDSHQVWDAALVARCFYSFLHHYKAGLACLEEATRLADSQYQEALEDMKRVARTQYLQIRSLIHLIQFFQLREAYLQSKSQTLRQALIYVCEAEMENAREVLELCRKDSRIGFSCEGAGNVRGGCFTPAAIRQKLASLEETLAALYLEPSASPA